MTFEIYCTLLMSFGTISTLFVEFIKKFLDEKNKNYNIEHIAFCISGLVGGVGSFMWMNVNSMPITAKSIIWIFAEAVGVIIGSQIGYDKVLSIIKEMILAGKDN